jgi:hypothetical protein
MKQGEHGRLACIKIDMAKKGMPDTSANLDPIKFGSIVIQSVDNPLINKFCMKTFTSPKILWDLIWFEFRGV